MHVFLYELITGGGWTWRQGAWPPPASLLAEGAAMLGALAADFASSTNCEISCLRDARLPAQPADRCRVVSVHSRCQEREAFARLAAKADWTVVIAPEFDGLLLDRCRLAESVGGRLLGPSSALVELAGDKQATAEHLAARGIPVPQGMPLDAGMPWPDRFSYPAVWKPRFGAGSQGLLLVQSAADAPLVFDGLSMSAGEASDNLPSVAGRLERYHRGVAASVAFLCGSAGCYALSPCRQVISDDGRFRYLGGSLPLEPVLSARATRLATGAVAGLPGARGYLGVDLVLGDAPGGSQDVVVEVNPRLTTSYVGLRALASVNLAEAMFAAAVGRSIDVTYRAGRVRFEPNGAIHRVGQQ